jgi:hypothetical protein
MQTPSPDDIILWPDDFHCFRSELSEFNDKSDDYRVVYFGTAEWNELAAEPFE